MLRLIRKFVFLTVLCLPAASADRAVSQDQKPDERIGKKVIVTEAGAPLRTPEAVVWKAWLGETYTVALTNGEWLWIAEKGGWLWEKQTVMFDKAVDEFTQRIRKDPSAENYHLRGVAWLAHDQYDKAIADFTLSLNKEPKQAGVFNNRGQAHYLKQDYTSAVSDFDAAVRADKKHFVALNNRALCHIAVQDYNAALRDLNSAVRLNKEYAEALNNRGVVHSLLGKYRNAVDDFSAALLIDDRYIDAYGNRSFAYRQLSRFTEAVTDLRTAMKKDPLDYKPVNDLAWMLATISEESVRNPKEAISLAKKACEMTQYENWNALDTLAAAYAAEGSFKKAQQWVATAIEKAPDDAKEDLQQHLKLIQDKKPIEQ